MLDWKRVDKGTGGWGGGEVVACLHITRETNGGGSRGMYDKFRREGGNIAKLASLFINSS